MLVETTTARRQREVLDPSTGTVGSEEPEASLTCPFTPRRSLKEDKLNRLVATRKALSPYGRNALVWTCDGPFDDQESGEPEQTELHSHS